MYLHDLEPRCTAAKLASHKPQRPGWSWNGTRWWFGQGGKGQNESCNGKQGWTFAWELRLHNCHTVWCCHGCPGSPCVVSWCVRAGRGCRRAQSCPTCLGSSGVRWQAAVMGGSLCGRLEAFELSLFPISSLPTDQRTSCDFCRILKHFFFFFSPL